MSGVILDPHKSDNIDLSCNFVQILIYTYHGIQSEKKNSIAFIIFCDDWLLLVWPHGPATVGPPAQMWLRAMRPTVDLDADDQNRLMTCNRENRLMS